MKFTLKLKGNPSKVDTASTTPDVRSDPPQVSLASKKRKEHPDPSAFSGDQAYTAQNANPAASTATPKKPKHSQNPGSAGTAAGQGPGTFRLKLKKPFDSNGVAGSKVAVPAAGNAHALSVQPAAAQSPAQPPGGLKKIKLKAPKLHSAPSCSTAVSTPVASSRHPVEPPASAAAGAVSSGLAGLPKKLKLKTGSTKIKLNGASKVLPASAPFTAAAVPAPSTAAPATNAPATPAAPAAPVPVAANAVAPSQHGGPAVLATGGPFPTAASLAPAPVVQPPQPTGAVPAASGPPGPARRGRMAREAKMAKQVGEDIKPRMRSGPPSAAEPAVIIKLLDHLQEKDPNRIFAEPVTEAQAPDYFQRITQPMDFSTMRKKVEAGQYSTWEQVEDDLALMCNNCMVYNGYRHALYPLAKNLKQDVYRAVDLAKEGIQDFKARPATMRSTHQQQRNVEEEKRAQQRKREQRAERAAAKRARQASNSALLAGLGGMANSANRLLGTGDDNARLTYRERLQLTGHLRWGPLAEGSSAEGVGFAYPPSLKPTGALQLDAYAMSIARFASGLKGKARKLVCKKMAAVLLPIKPLPSSEPLVPQQAIAMQQQQQQLAMQQQQTLHKPQPQLLTTSAAAAHAAMTNRINGLSSLMQQQANRGQPAQVQQPLQVQVGAQLPMSSQVQLQTVRSNQQAVQLAAGQAVQGHMQGLQAQGTGQATAFVTHGQSHVYGSTAHQAQQQQQQQQVYLQQQQQQQQPRSQGAMHHMPAQFQQTIAQQQQQQQQQPAGYAYQQGQHLQAHAVGSGYGNGAGMQQANFPSAAKSAITAVGQPGYSSSQAFRPQSFPAAQQPGFAAATALQPGYNTMQQAQQPYGQYGQLAQPQQQQAPQQYVGQHGYQQQAFTQHALQQQAPQQPQLYGMQSMQRPL